MKKRNYLNKYLTSMMLCLFVLSAFLFNGCSDDDITYPTEEQKKPYIVTDWIGKLTYEKSKKKWVIYPEDKAIGTVICMIIENMAEEYEAYEGRVKFSGISAVKYFVGDNSQFGYEEVVESLELTSIESYIES